MRAFNRNPEIRLLAADNTPLPFAKDKLIKEGFQLGRDYEQELAEYNSSNAPAALATLVSVPNQQAQVQPEVNTLPPSSAASSEQIKQKQSQAESPAVNQQKTEAEPPMTKEMLRYWYEKADEKTRQEFLQDIKKNN